MTLDALFSPQSVAVIGASAAPEKVGGIVLNNLIDGKFPGKIYPINPKETAIRDIPVFASIDLVPEVVDMVVIAIPSKFVNDELKKIGEKGMKNVVILTAGFKEMGGEGLQMEQDMIAIAKQYCLNILGPNCLGYMNSHCPINATFSKSVSIPGNFCFISQSGAIASSLFDYCESVGIGLSEVFSVGNKAVLGENDILEYLLAQEHDSDTPRPIGLYLESIEDGQKFVEIATKVSRRDPVFILKPGKSDAAKHAMQSHTGSIAGADNVLTIALKQAGVTRCDTMEDFFDYLRAFTWGKVPQGKRIALITNAGGPGVITSDAVIAEGMELAQFDDATAEKMRSVLPACASVHNPIDVLGDALPDRFAAALEVVMQSSEVDVVLVILTPQMMTQVQETAELVGRLAQQYNKPIFCSFIGGVKVDAGEKVLNAAHVVNFRYPERAVKVIADMYNWKKWQLTEQATQQESVLDVTIDMEKIKAIIDPAMAAHQPSLDNVEANHVLDAAGVHTPATRTVASLDDALQFAKEYGWPIVLKLSAPGLLHKADIGGVVVGIDSDEKMTNAWNNLQANMTKIPEDIRKNASVQLQQQACGGIEVIVGVKRDVIFGPVFLFGMGGGLAEFVDDHNLHLLPITPETARSVVESSKVYTLLKGYRGQPALAVERLVDLIVHVARLMEVTPEATEIEINPVIVTETDVWAVDGKVVLKGE